jgi:hypothetical protein
LVVTGFDFKDCAWAKAVTCTENELASAEEVADPVMAAALLEAKVRAFQVVVSINADDASSNEAREDLI